MTSSTQIATAHAPLPALVPHHPSGVATMITDPKAVVAQVQAIQQIMKAVMKEGVHFGIIPGTGRDGAGQPSLYKPGSEVLLSAFKIGVEPHIREIRDGNHITYVIECVGKHIASGLTIGVGVGEASTAEDKYAWRAAVCPEEFEATPEDRRRVKWNKGKWDNATRSNGPGWSVQQVRTNPADISNTVLKMAKKRAQIDLCLTALAASDIFTQDIEDLPEGYLDGEQQAPRQTKNNRYQERPKSGQPQSAPTGNASENQIKMIRAKMAAMGKTEADLMAHFKVEAMEAFPKAKVNEALEWIADKGEK